MASHTRPPGGRVEGKVAFITGAARGQGRSHAVRLAEEGADIIAIDLCSPIDTVGYPMATSEDLAETVRLVEALDRRIVARQADVRDVDAVKAAVDDGVSQFGRLDIVSANAGIFSAGLSTELAEKSWQDMLDVNLTGVWHTCNAALPHMIEAGNGGSIVITSSAAGLKGLPGMSHYVSAKHGLVGLMRSLAREVAPHNIRVNSLHPTTVKTDMVTGEDMRRLFRPDLEEPTIDDLAEVLLPLNALPVAWIESIDISNALLFFASDEARYITGVTLAVDAGALIL